MSRILSQDEVEALLRGVAQGAVPAGGGATGRRGVQAIDLTSQERSLRGRLPGLELVVDRLARALRASLASFLGRPPELRVRALELLRFARVTAALPEPVALHLFRMPPLRGQGMLGLSAPLAASVLDGAFGGAPGRPAPAMAREFSPVELRVLERLGTRALHDLRDAFRPLAAIEFGGLRAEGTAVAAAMAGPQDLVVLLDLAVDLPEVSDARLFVCIPNAALDPIRQRLQAGAEGDGTAGGAGFGDRLRASLAGVELEVTAELGTHRLRVRDVLNLRAGDVIPLRTGREGPVLVRVEGRPRFLAAPGMQGSSNAVRITSRI